jgi:hypothetical protein
MTAFLCTFITDSLFCLVSKPGKGGREGSPAAPGSGVSNADPLANEQIKPPAPETTPKPAAPKNETPHKFWAYVEPYCAPIQLEDVKFLEDLIKVGN